LPHTGTRNTCSQSTSRFRARPTRGNFGLTREEEVSQFYPDLDRLLRQRVVDAYPESDGDEETNPRSG
jgi:hypothetical protein